MSRVTQVDELMEAREGRSRMIRAYKLVTLMQGVKITLDRESAPMITLCLASAFSMVSRDLVRSFAFR